MRTIIQKTNNMLFADTWRSWAGSAFACAGAACLFEWTRGPAPVIAIFWVLTAVDIVVAVRLYRQA